METGDRLLMPGEVAGVFRVDTKTIARWNEAGLLACIRTPTGHRRYRESDVRALLQSWSDGQPVNDLLPKP